MLYNTFRIDILFTQRIISAKSMYSSIFDALVLLIEIEHYDAMRNKKYFLLVSYGTQKNNMKFTLDCS